MSNQQPTGDPPIPFFCPNQVPYRADDLKLNTKGCLSLSEVLIREQEAIRERFLGLSEPHHNGLTPAEAEALDVLQEECAEVIQAVSKIKRFGLYSQHKVTGVPRLTDLSVEIGDVLAAIKVVQKNVMHQGSLDDTIIQLNVAEKLRRLVKHVYHLVVPQP